MATTLDAKLIANLAALAALAGLELHKLDGGGFLITRWNLVRALADVAAVEAFINQLQRAP